MKIHLLVVEVDVVVVVVVVEVVEAKFILVLYSSYPRCGSSRSILLVVEVEPIHKRSSQFG